MANEKRLIDANALMKAIKSFRWFGGYPPNTLKLMFDYLKIIIDGQPTVDAVEVVHGRWVIKSEIHRMLDDFDEEFYVECPLCGRTFYIPFEFDDGKMIAYAKEKYPYCNCGAKMDGDGNGTTKD